VITDINLGRALVLTGDLQGGLSSNRKALAICEVLVAENPGRADYRRLLANAYQNDGDYRAILHDVGGAIRSFRKKLTFDEQSLAEDSLNAVARGDLAYTHVRLGDLLADAGRHDEALAHYRKAQAENITLKAETSDDPHTRLAALMVRGGIGEMRARRGERDAALAEASKSLALLEEIAADPASGARSSLRGQVYRRVAAIYAALGASASIGTAERRQHLGTARDLYARSLVIWQDMQKRGILTAEDAAKPEEVVREIARCDDSLRRLEG
jgi:tetratricopeptide (TPR) repeat protein